MLKKTLALSLLQKSFLTCAFILPLMLITITSLHGFERQIPFSDELVNDTCNVIAPNNGHYHYATLPAGMIKAKESTSLPAMTQTWAVQCTAETSVEFTVQDLRYDSLDKTNNTHFGLGYVNNSGKLGYYQIQLSNAKVNNHSARIYQTSSSYHVSTQEEQIFVIPNKIFGWANNEARQSIGRSFAIDVTILPTLNNIQATNGPLVNGGEIDGLAEFMFSFGL